jgi:hypothetical protein
VYRTVPAALWQQTGNNKETVHLRSKYFDIIFVARTLGLVSAILSTGIFYTVTFKKIFVLLYFKIT